MSHRRIGLRARSVFRALGACFGASALVLVTATPASAEDGPAAPEHAATVGGTRFLITPSIGWMRGHAYDVPLDMLDAQIGFGASFAPDAMGFSADLAGLVAFQTGTTQYGRRLSGGDALGLELVMHYRWLRFGAGARLGTLAVQRATRNDSESELKADGYVSVGVEPFAVAGQPFFVEARLHELHWGDTSAALWIGAGFRWCAGRCTR